MGFTLKDYSFELKIIKNNMPKGLMGFQKGELNPSKSLEARKRTSERLKGTMLSALQKRKISRSMKQVLKNPDIRKRWYKFPTGELNPTKDPKVIEKIRLTVAKRPKKKSTCFKKADSIFSLYIRNKHSKEGMNQCITCQKWFPISELDCGHYISRQHHSLRYSEQNVAPQCRSCNRFHEGRKDEFALYLIKKYGTGILEELHKQKNVIKQFTCQELTDLIEHYKSKLKELL